ncbi:TonB-dependent receptor [Pseudomonas songnenensis]|uniref:TonB-dependent siderophore receptor n=1 Tax=Pseudomonas songnenensis TaxID=1176259 RepID=A0A482UKW9_9PSED|nr:TonB-dependent receptor [Pseudomonas songnenensis]RYJ63008.1 TonB-dependent siderophore receptor [Pseudomonas songnenensis]
MSTLRFPRKTALLPVCLAASFAGFPLMAQEQLEDKPQRTAAEPVELQSVEITASADASADGLTQPYAGEQVARGGRVGILGNRDYMETPFTSTSYTSQLIQDQQARSVSDVLQNDPSVRVARGFGNFQELYVVRGFPVYSDDISYNGLYGLLPRQYVAAEFIERVEVFRGANTFLNGAAPGGSGIGGAINILPKRAPNEPLTRLTVGAENGGQAMTHADIARRFGEEERFGVRLNAAKRAGETTVEDEDRTLDMFALGLDYQGDNFRLSGDIGHQYHFIDNPRPSVRLNGGVPSAPDAEDNFAQPWTYSKEKQTFGTFRGEYDFSDSLTGWLAAGVREGEEKNRLANPLANASGATTAYRFDNVREEEIRTSEVGLRGLLKTGPVSHQWVVSAAMFSAEDRNAWAASDWKNPFTGDLNSPTNTAMPPVDLVDPIKTAGSMSNPKVTARTDTQSLAIADTLGFMDDRLLVTLGARRQGIESKGYDYDTGERASAYNRYETTPVAGVVYQLSDELSVYANYIEGLVKGDIAPSTIWVDNANRSVSNGGQALAPYVSKQTEVGLKYDGGNVGGSLAVFQTKRPFATFEYDVASDALEGTYAENGEQRNRGIELSMFGEPLYGVRLLGGLTLLDAEMTSTRRGLNDGNRVIGVPRTQANIGTEWDVPNLQNLTLTARALYTGKQYADAANELEIPSWTRFDLGARYRMVVDDRDVTLRANLENVAGRDYWASAGGYPDNGYLVLGAPRTLSVSATVDF